MKKKETSMKLPYSSPAIDVISLKDRLEIICGSPLSGKIGGGDGDINDIPHVGDDQW